MSARPQRERASARRPTGPWLDRLRCAGLWMLPQHAISRRLFGLTRLRTGAKDPIVRWFIRRFGVDMSEAAEPNPRAYATFNSFFTRALRDDARPLAGDEATVVSPVDGRLSAQGTVEGDRLIQAKGIDYSLTALLGGDAGAADRFQGGGYASLYLAPGDYHRIHMPLTGRLTHMVYVPGRLHSVAPWTVALIDGLFARNERVCAFFETAAGPLGLILVGAINVAAIETTWAGLVTPPRRRRVSRWDYGSDGPVLERGCEMGRFNMGSTVVVLAPPGSAWDDQGADGRRVHFGQALGRTG